MLPRQFSISLLVFLLIVLTGEAIFFYWREHQPQENPYDPIIVSLSHNAGVDPLLVRALIWRESKFKPETHGAADERGLMQVTPEVGRMWAKAKKITDFQNDDLYDPVTNIRAGTWYLSQAIKRWHQADDPVPFALAEYNAGRSNALKWVDPDNPQDHVAFLQRITFPSTRKYVEDILTMREEYRTLLVNNRWYRELSAPNPAMTLTP